ncbi:hypothetical protein [Azospirillum sp. B2RO_4]|uniref:hypothetical protein n=1 Tax=Azospirillum sp. B2RO_4 TaxID=3027796 RepID=UPI003DA9ED7A
MSAEIILPILVGIAKKKGRDTYTNVSVNLGWDMRLSRDRNKISKVLYEISWEEHQNGRPLLSVVVVRGRNGVPTSNPGKGFYVMARGMGFEFQDDEQFFREELKRVHDYWAKLK